MKDLSPQDQKERVPLVSRTSADQQTIVRVQEAVIGGDSFTVMAGPCAVESEEQILDIARHVKAAGASVIRGGAFKPMTFPYRNASTFELREKGLEFLAAAGSATGLPVVTEVIDPRLVETVARKADILQIGSRNMQNFPLLEEVAKSQKPVILKRHFGCSLRDWLGAAEYLVHGGNSQVILCERGVVAPHTHETTSRFIVDLQVIPAAKEYTHLPIIVDPSHATFKRSYVASIARAALAAGADGLLIDVHPTPEKAAIDPLQALSYEAFEALMNDLRAMAKVLGRRMISPKETVHA